MGRAADAPAAAARMPCSLRAGGVAGRGGRALALRALGGRPAARVHGLPARRARAHQAAGGGRRGGGGGRGRRRAAGPGRRAADAPRTASLVLPMLHVLETGPSCCLFACTGSDPPCLLTCQDRSSTSRHADYRVPGATSCMPARAKDASWPCVRFRRRTGGWSAPAAGTRARP